MVIGSNDFVLPEGAHASFGGYFDPDLGLGLVGGNTIPVDESIDLANENLRKYGFEPIDTAENVVNSIASEVGDDEIEVSSSRASVSLNLVFSRLLGMRDSEKDTSINPRYGNFCEELIVLPDGYGQTYQNAKNTSSWKDMSFIDIPKLRLAINIRPMRMDHSSTNDGKAGMVGSRLSWLSNDNPMKILYEVFNLFQDVNLGLTSDKKFAYLPTELGGYGKQIPFSNASNLESFISSYKYGAHAPVIRSIVRRSSRFMDSVSRGVRPKPDLLLNHVSRFSTSFHDWVKGHSIYAPTAWIDIPPEVEQYRVGELGLSPVNDDAFSRLIAEGHLVTENKIQVVVEHNLLCEALVKSTSIPEFKRIRDAARSEWRNLSVFGLETYGLIQEIKPDQSEFRLLKPHEVSYFSKQVGERKGLLRTLFRHESVYSREAIDSLYMKGPMFVRFQMTPKNKIGGMQFVNQTRFRDDTVDTEDRQGEDEILSWVKSKCTGPVPRRVINDDHAIIQFVSEQTGGSVVVTDDIRLCKEANRKTGRPVFRVPCEWYYRALYFSEVPDPWMKFLRNRTGIDWFQIEDQGSLVSFEEGYFHNGVMLKEARRTPFRMSKGLYDKDVDILKEDENFSDDPPGHPDNYLYDNRAVVSRRRRRDYTSNSA